MRQVFSLRTFSLNPFLAKACLLLVGLLGFVPVNAKSGKYRVMFRTDPATSFTVAWDQLSGKRPLLHYWPKELGPEPTPDQVKQQLADRVEHYKGMKTHFARLSNLAPGRAYYFRVIDSEGQGRLLWSQTIPAKADSLSIIAGGDSRSNPEICRQTNQMVRLLKPQAVLFGGDFTLVGTSKQWQQWLEDWQEIIGKDGYVAPLVASRGNHEFSAAMVYRLFDVPTPATYYALNFGGDLLRTYTLNTEIAIDGDQTNWFENDLATHHQNTIWRIAQYHKPMRPHVARKKEGNAQYRAWAPLIHKYRVQLVIECDAHVVKNTWPIRPSTEEGSHEGFIRDDKTGTVYSGEGTWAVTRVADDPKPWTRNIGSFHQAKLIWVTRTTIEKRTILSDRYLYELEELAYPGEMRLPDGLQVWQPEGEAPNFVLTIQP